MTMQPFPDALEKMVCRMLDGSILDGIMTPPQPRQLSEATLMEYLKRSSLPVQVPTLRRLIAMLGKTAEQLHDEYFDFGLERGREFAKHATREILDKADGIHPGDDADSICIYLLDALGDDSGIDLWPDAAVNGRSSRCKRGPGGQVRPPAPSNRTHREGKHPNAVTLETLVNTPPEQLPPTN
jgi:hypothetical protein